MLELYFCPHPVVPGGGETFISELMICADTAVLLCEPG